MEDGKVNQRIKLSNYLKVLVAAGYVVRPVTFCDRKKRKKLFFRSVILWNKKWFDIRSMLELNARLVGQ